MTNPLVLCESCARHVRASESACPFCRGALPGNVVSRTAPKSRLGRAAMFAFGAAALAVSAAACGDDDDVPTPPVDSGTADLGPRDSGGEDDLGTAIDAGGEDDLGTATDAGGADDLGTATDAGQDAGVDLGGVAPAYGIPPSP